MLNVDDVKIIIDNNVDKTPTIWAEEAAERIANMIINAVPPGAPDKIKEQAIAYKQIIHEETFKICEELFTRALNRHKEKLLGGK